MHKRQGKQTTNLWPAVYHAHHQLHLEDLGFWLELAADLNDPLLELGCGSGRVLLPLAEAGRRMFGIDIDADMLNILRKQLTPKVSRQVRLIQTDFTYFHLEARFGLILLPCNTLSTLLPIQQQALLANVIEHLAPDGVFAASIPNPAVLVRLPRHSEPEIEETFTHPIDGEPVQVSSAWERKDDSFTVHWYYDHLLPDGKVDRLEARVQQYIIPVDNYIDSWRSAGFNTITLFGDFDRSPYQKTSPHLILTAQR